MDFIADIFQYRYLMNALIACLLSGVTCGIIGTYIVARRMVFLSGGITHASFGGIGIAFYLGVNPILGALLFATISAVGIEYAGSRMKIREDSAIGLVWGLGMAVGALFMSMRPGYTSGDLSNFLFGSIVTVTTSDVVMLAILTLILLVAALLWLRPIMYVAFDREFAASAGVRTKTISYLMSIATAVCIVLSIRVMGIVLLVSLLTMPIVIANMVTKDYRLLTIYGSVIASIAGVTGIALSYYLEVPSGPAIIFILTLALIIVKLLSLHQRNTCTN